MMSLCVDTLAAGARTRRAREMSIGAERSPRPRVWWTYAALLCMGALFLVLAVTSLTGKSVTVDEFGHLPTGLNLIGHGEMRYAHLNPPLARLLSALPLAAAGVPPIATDALAFQQRYDFWANGYAFMQREADTYHAHFVRARWVSVCLALLLGALAFFWTRRLAPAHAGWGGLLAAGLIWFDPNLLAHARLVTTDLALTLFLLLALFALERFLRRPAWTTALACGITLGLAQLVKFSAVYLYVTHLVLILIWVGRAPGRRRRLLGLGLVALVVSVFVLDAGYAFQRVGRMVSEISFRSDALRGLAALLPPRLMLPLPEDFLRAFDLQLLDAQTGDPSYLLGRSYVGGRWDYFPVLLLSKTPLPLLLLFGLAVGIRLRALRGRRPPDHARYDLILLLPAGLLLAVFGLLSEKQLGLRMILPCVALIWIWVAATWASFPLRRGATLLLIACCLWLGIETSAVHPHYLPYYNPLAGGPERGHLVAVDSNCDWGQDLPALARYMDEEGIESVQLLYFGRVDPVIYGIEYDVPRRAGRPGHLAVSRTLYGRGYVLPDHGRLVQGGPYPFDSDPPGVRVASLGHSIDVYRIGDAAPGK
ncbi:MAG: phospholipid carrier-dependent glycosyltransferase [Candidatus Eisenbacteria bacterium]|nr:phospholipid carrier-dependent glycosyltransferase [Candidatus Eisenbacteria bacterium]